MTAVDNSPQESALSVIRVPTGSREWDRSSYVVPTGDSIIKPRIGHTRCIKMLKLETVWRGMDGMGALPRGGGRHGAMAPPKFWLGHNAFGPTNNWPVHSLVYWTGKRLVLTPLPENGDVGTDSVEATHGDDGATCWWYIIQSCVWQWWQGAVVRSHAGLIAVISTVTYLTPTHVGTY